MADDNIKIFPGPRVEFHDDQPAALVTITPIPIRADLTVKIQGIPLDLTKAEAEKIARVVEAMASI